MSILKILVMKSLQFESFSPFAASSFVYSDAAHTIYVKTLDEAAELIEKGFYLWMGAKGKRASLISPQSLRIVRGGKKA